MVAAQGSSPRKITNLDFPKIAREKYGIEAVEFVNQFFKDKAHDSTYLKDLKKRANDNGVTCVLIMIDGEGDLSAADTGRADKAVENHKKWVDAAAALGCHSIRVNTGPHYSPTDVATAAEACGAADRIRRRRTRSTSSARTTAGRRATPTRLLALMKAVNKPRLRHPSRLRQLPQGHADGKYMIDVYDAIARMMPYAKGVSAKSYDFDATGRRPPRLRPDPQDRHRHRLHGLCRHRVRGEPADRTRRDHGHQEAARIAPGGELYAGRLSWYSSISFHVDEPPGRVSPVRPARTENSPPE